MLSLALPRMSSWLARLGFGLARRQRTCGRLLRPATRTRTRTRTELLLLPPLPSSTPRRFRPPPAAAKTLKIQRSRPRPLPPPLLRPRPWPGEGSEDEEVRRLLAAFPVVFPSLTMILVHDCMLTDRAERVLDGLADVYAVLGAKVPASARGGGGVRGVGGGGGGVGAGAASSSSSPVARSFKGICRGCPAWNFSIKLGGDIYNGTSPEEP